ncbi:unnamed protein product, partial [Brenthis ino]
MVPPKKNYLFRAKEAEINLSELCRAHLLEHKGADRRGDPFDPTACNYGGGRRGGRGLNFKETAATTHRCLLLMCEQDAAYVLTCEEKRLIHVCV